LLSNGTINRDTTMEHIMPCHSVSQNTYLVARRWHSKHLHDSSDATTIGGLLKVVFSVWSVPRLCDKDQHDERVRS
jgi:hypothetical protein